MNVIARTRDLRVCPACWSVVQPDDLPEHDAWHERVRSDAITEARALLVGP